MHTYRPGDKVRILKAVSYNGSDLSDKWTVGDICEVKYDTNTNNNTWVYTKDKSDYQCFAQDAIEPAKKTWDNLGARDVLVDVHDEDSVVQGVIGEVVLLTRYTGDMVSEFVLCYSKLQLQRRGYTIKQSEQTDDVVEPTLDDVAKLKGVSVEKTRIKE